jgi:rhamnogalacturonyl hydrolase YesR
MLTSLKPCFILPCAIIATACSTEASLDVRKAVSSTDAPERLIDSLSGTWWNSIESGDHASFLLNTPAQVEAEFVLSEGELGQAKYQILSSMNYRDWTLLSEGIGEEITETSTVRRFDSTEARYLRFVSLHEGSVSWNARIGGFEEVSSWLLSNQPVDWGDITDPDVIALMLDLAFDWQHAHPTTIHNGKGWITGAFYSGVSALYEETQLEKYRLAILNHGNTSAWTLHDFTWGKKTYHADNQCIGQTWLEFYMRESSSPLVWIADIRARLDWVMANAIPGREDYSWCDALYMGPPNYVRLATITGEDKYRTFIDTQWWDSVDYLYDKDYHLFYRDDRFFDAQEPNGMPVFWGRGNGWVLGGTVRMLQYIPEDWPTRQMYIDLLAEMAEAVAQIQGDDGLWSSSLLDPGQFDFERETSGSAFFTYAIAWGVNNGLLDEVYFGPVIEKAWAGLSTMLTPEGILQFIQQQGAAPALVNDSLTDKDYGYGAFLLAGTEMMKYYAKGVPEVQASLIESYIASQGDSIAAEEASDWALVEDFENGFNWSVHKTLNANETLQSAPYDSEGTRAFCINTGERTFGVYRATTSIPAVPEGSVATVYQRFCFNNPEIDVVFGISDQAVVDEYADYENGLRIYPSFNQLEARSGSEYIVIGDDFLQLETWYEAWTVIDNSTDTYDVYLRGGSNYPEQVLVRENIPFRNGTSGSIISYAVSYNGALSEGDFYLDDVYVKMDGVNLSRPEGVRQPSYSPWSDFGRDQGHQGKFTNSGWLWDENYPWAYFNTLSTWGYVFLDESSAEGIYAWLADRSMWIWLPLHVEGWYFDLEARQWMASS